MASSVLGKFIKKRRKDLNITQKKLAESIGFKTSQFISNIERGLSRIPSSKIEDFARELKVDPAELSSLVTESLKAKLLSTESSHLAYRDPFIDDFISSWVVASPSDRELIKSLVSKVLKIEE